MENYYERGFSRSTVAAINWAQALSTNFFALMIMWALGVI